MLNSLVFVCCWMAKIIKNSTIHIQTCALERRKSPLFSSVTLMYISYFKIFKYVKFVRFRILPKAKIMGKKSTMHI